MKKIDRKHLAHNCMQRGCYKKITAQEAEIILAEVIDILYLQYKTDFRGKGKPHSLGFFKEKVKSDFHYALMR